MMIFNRGRESLLASPKSRSPCAVSPFRAESLGLRRIGIEWTTNGGQDTKLSGIDSDTDTDSDPEKEFGILPAPEGKAGDEYLQNVKSGKESDYAGKM